LLGNEIVTKLFGSINPVGQVVRVDGRPKLVVGILEQQPQLFGQSQDNYMVMPITTGKVCLGKGREVSYHGYVL